MYSSSPHNRAPVQHGKREGVLDMRKEKGNLCCSVASQFRRGEPFFVVVASTSPVCVAVTPLGVAAGAKESLMPLPSYLPPPLELFPFFIYTSTSPPSYA
jgi:hypothetical protein